MQSTLEGYGDVGCMEDPIVAECHHHEKSDEFVLDSSLGMNTTKRHLTEDTGMYQMKNIMTFYNIYISQECMSYFLSVPPT